MNVFFVQINLYFLDVFVEKNESKNVKLPSRQVKSIEDNKNAKNSRKFAYVAD